MAAHICHKPKGSCKTCEHRRWDDDRNDYACFAFVDEKKKSDAERSDKT